MYDQVLDENFQKKFEKAKLKQKRAFITFQDSRFTYAKQFLTGMTVWEVLSTN
jgi:hypothetical protein